MITFLLLGGAVFLIANVIGAILVLRKRRRLLNAYKTGMAEGAGQPGADALPRGAGGLTAAETTAVANHLLAAMSKGHKQPSTPGRPGPNPGSPAP